MERHVLLCDVIFLVRLQGKIEIDQSLGKERLKSLECVPSYDGFKSELNWAAKRPPLASGTHRQRVQSEQFQRVSELKSNWDELGAERQETTTQTSS